MEDNPEGMEVDIGYMPVMELVSRGHSRPSLMFGDKGNSDLSKVSYQIIKTLNLALEIFFNVLITL